MRRRAFITLLAQAPAKIGRLGFLGATFAASWDRRMEAFQSSLRDLGYLQGKNIFSESRWAEERYNQLPVLAEELVRLRVDILLTYGTPGTLAAKQATTEIPIVFFYIGDAVSTGVVSSLARPGANVTGNTYFLTTTRGVNAAARPLGLQIQPLEAATSSEIDFAFTTLQRDHPDALFVGADPYFTARRIQIVQHAAHGSIPATYATRETAEVGGLMSYGASIPDAYHMLGVYIGRILKGVKPPDLPVAQASKFELVINHQTAKMLGLTVPPSLLSIADEVIE